MAFTGTTRGGKKSNFQGRIASFWTAAQVLFWDNNEDVISTHLATLKLVLPELDRAGLLSLSPDARVHPKSCQVTEQAKFKK